MKKGKTWPLVLVGLLFFNALLIGSLLGGALAATLNTINTENFTSFETALPTRILDVNGELITEFASDEKREIIALNKLPQHMIDALLTREDRIFYSHHGFSAKALTRAVLGVLQEIHLEEVPRFHSRLQVHFTATEANTPSKENSRNFGGQSRWNAIIQRTKFLNCI